MCVSVLLLQRSCSSLLAYAWGCRGEQALGDVVFVELPEVGKEFKAGASVAAVESVKAASDVYLPVAGTITAVNKEVTSDRYFLFVLCCSVVVVVR